MDGWQISTIVATLVAAGFGGAWLFRKGTGLEHLRKEIQVISTHARAHGWEILADILDSIIVRDYSTAIANVKELFKLLVDTEKRNAHFSAIYVKAVKEEMKDPEQAAKYVAMVDEYKLVVEAKKKEQAAIDEAKAKQQAATIAAAVPAVAKAAADAAVAATKVAAVA